MNPEYEQELSEQSESPTDSEEDFSPDSESSDNEPTPEPDLNLNLNIGDYRITEKSPANNTYLCRNNYNDEVSICSVIKTEDFFTFDAIHKKVKNFPGANKVVKIITQRNKNLVIYQKTYGDLHDYARTRQQVDERETANLFYQIVRTFRDCFLHGVLLRDLKLKKLVFYDRARTLICFESWEDSVILLDPSNDTLSERCSCPTYGSPEVLDRQVTSFSGEKAASWSLGVIFYALLTGRYPFHHRDQNVLRERVNKGVFSMPKHITDQAQNLLLNLLNKSVSLRFTASQILSSDFFTIHGLGDPSMVDFFRCPPTCDVPTHGHATSTQPVPHHVAQPFNPPNTDQVVPDIDKPETL